MAYGRLLGSDAAGAAGGVSGVDHADAAAGAACICFRQVSWPQTKTKGVVFGAIDVPANATLEQLLPFTGSVCRIFKETPEFDHSFQITFPSGGFGGMVVKPWNERKRSIFPIQGRGVWQDLADHGHWCADVLPRRCRARERFRVEFVIASTASHEELVRFAEQLVQEATKSGLFAFPPMMDVRIDQAKTEIVIDRDKVASMGLSMQQVGADLSSMLSGNFVNRFNIDGRSYKVIPQIERAGRLTAEQLKDIYITGPGGQVMPLSAVASLRSGVEPRTLNRFQQLNAVKISGLAPRSLEQALRFMEDTAGQDSAARLSHRLHRRVAPAASGGRQVPTGDGAGAGADLLGAGGAV
jgi:multidrug efflux pump